MAELYLILDLNNQIIHSWECNISSDKDYCKIYLFTYASLDILDCLITKSNCNFIYCINKSFNTVSAYIMRCGIKIVAVTENKKSKEEVERNLEFLNEMFAKEIIKGCLESKEFYEKIERFLIGKKP